MTVKLSDAQIGMLRNVLAPMGADGAFYPNKPTVEALKTKGLVDFAWSDYHKHNAYIINAAGCEAIGLDYNDVITTRLQKRAKQMMGTYVADESVCATEAELVEWAGWMNDPQYLINAYIACGGEMIVEDESPAPDSTLADELPAYQEAVIDDEEFELEQLDIVMQEYDALHAPHSDEEKARTAALHTRMNVRLPEDEIEIDPRDTEIETLRLRVAALEEESARREAILSKHREFVRDMCGYSFSDRDDARFVSDCVDELEGN